MSFLPQTLTDQLERANVLDAPAERIGRTVRGLLSSGPVKDALSGTWLGHPAHPPMTEVVIGSFLSVSLLDLLSPGSERASRRLLGVGLAASLPTALSGASDWADSEAGDASVRRVGLVHAAANTSSLCFYAASLAARRRGSRAAGTLLALAGATGLGLSGFLGGHLAYTRGVGANQTAFDPGPDDWTAVADSGEVPAGETSRAFAMGTPVLLLRHAEGIHAIHDRCSHRGCSLTDGELSGHVITCPCHGSQFDLTSGSVLRGPATAPQPVLETREIEGRVEVRLRGHG